MIIAGVDLGGRKIAISLWEEGYLSGVTSYSVPKTTRARELCDLADWSMGILRMAEFAVIEEPLVGRSIRSSLQLAHTAGAILSRLGDTKTHTSSAFVEVSTWKKEVVGRGNASKDEVRSWLEATYPAYAVRCGDDQDKVDATCIGLYGAKLLDRSTKLAEL